MALSKEKSKTQERDSEILKRVVKYLEKRVDSIESAIKDEINPLHRIELEIARRENMVLLNNIKTMQEISKPNVLSNIVKDLFN